MNASATRPNPYRGGLPGNSECVNGWRGLTPLALNPLYGTAGAGTEFYDPAVIAAVKWTHWDDLRNVYGVGADGYAKVPWDNVGVQYGLKALNDGNITPAEFLKLNATVGSWKETRDMVQEGCPFFPAPGCSNPATWDPWSRRNMRLSPDGGVTPAPRREGNMEAANAAYTSGIVFRGDIDIPIIDWRHYLEARARHAQLAPVVRVAEADAQPRRRASNQVIWFTDARPARASDQTPLAFAVIDEWLANIARTPRHGVAGNKPAAAVDSCFATNGSLHRTRATTPGTGILDSAPAGRARRRSRSSRPRGSSRAARSRAASSSARSSRWRRRSRTGRTHRGCRTPLRWRGWSRSSRPACATTPGPTSGDRRASRRANGGGGSSATPIRLIRPRTPLPYGARLSSLETNCRKRREFDVLVASRTRRAGVPPVRAHHAAAPAVASADDYVALGDSFSSGVGTNSYTLSSSCRRGVYAYPWLVAQQRPNTSLTFVACSGATTANVMSSQIQSVTAGTDIVTMTIGGNDIGFSNLIVQCTLGSCSSALDNTRASLGTVLAPGSTRCTRRSGAAR